MHHIGKKIVLFAALSINLILASCGAGGSSDVATVVSDSMTVNGVTYSAKDSSIRLLGLVDQASQYGYQMGGPAAFFSMSDSRTGNTIYLQLLSTSNGWPGSYYLWNTTDPDTARIKDNTVATGGNMVVQSGVNSGTVTINSFGSIGQPITGSFNINLCDSSAVCSSSVKKYTGTFRLTRAANMGSLGKTTNLSIPQPVASVYPFGIHPATGKNYFVIPSNATGGTLTITLVPTVDVNMAVYTDAAFTTPATCNVVSNLNVAGNGTETCAITVAANQKTYVTVSQPASATGRETFNLSIAE
jgi:hypothetical protein